MDQNQTNPILALLTPPRRKTLVSILVQAGQISLASIAVPFFLTDYNPTLSLLGVVFTVALWYAALVFSR